MDGFADNLFSVSMVDETGKLQKFFLFDSPQKHRIVKAVTVQGLAHTHHLVEPANQVRREQPQERYQVLVESEVKQRQLPVSETGSGNRKVTKKIISLEDMRVKVDAVIANREQQEQKSLATDGQPDDVEEVADMAEALTAIETIEPLIQPQSVQPKKKSAPKRSAAAAKGGASKKAKANPRKPTPHQSTEDAQVDEFQNAWAAELEKEEEGEDSLAIAISQKTGTDAKAVRNMDVNKILAGEPLGRTVSGVPCQ